MRGDGCRDGGALGKSSGAGPAGRDPPTEPRLSRLLLGLGQTGSGGPTEGDRRPDPVPENQQQGATVREAVWKPSMVIMCSQDSNST